MARVSSHCRCLNAMAAGLARGALKLPRSHALSRTRTPSFGPLLLSATTRFTL